MMRQILLLTKNTMNEEAFEKKIRQLGHEVFTSSLFLSRCLQGKLSREFVCIFQHVVLSETIDNNELKLVAENLKDIPIAVSRKSDGALSESEMQALGIKNVIECNPGVEVLREKLSQDKNDTENKLVFLARSEKKIPISSLVLSNAEMKLLKILYHQKGGRILSRENLCRQMWNKGKSNSTMSQLSVLVKNLKTKLNTQGITGPVVETCWGRGYQLHETIYDQLFIDTAELMYAHE